MNSLDAQSAPELFERGIAGFLEADEALPRIRENPGLIPVAIDPEYRVIWLDVGDYPFLEWKFRFSIRNLLEQRGIGTCFSTHIDILSMKELDLGCNRPPAGFVFHMSKCGSTAMSRILDQSTGHLVLKEPTPVHENLWQYLTENWRHPVVPSEANLRLVRNLLQAMGRVRLPHQESYFVKFRSWSTAFLDVIQQAFPVTPSLFMYREPVQVMASILSKPTTGLPRLNDCGAAAFITGVSDRELNGMDALDYFTRFYRQYLHIALTRMDGDFHHLNYREMNKDSLPAILREAFGYSPEEPVLAKMLAQLDVYSKDDSGTMRFTSDSTEKDRLVTPAMRQAADRHLMELYDRLEAHHKNLRWVVA